MKKALPILLFVSLFIITACSKKDEPQVEAKKSKPLIVVSNYPLQYFTERIGSTLIDVVFPASSADDPAHWKPTAEEISKVQKANLVIINGASYENWMENVTLAQSKIINTTQKIESELIALKGDVTHSHGPEGEHEHSGTAFTTWLDFSLAVEQARVIKEALIKILPDHKQEIQSRFDNLSGDLSALDSKLGQIVNNDIPVIFSHPVYQYLENRYGINGMSVHWEPDQIPNELMWHEFEKIIKKHPAKWIIWEGEPMAEVVAQLKKKGIGSIIFDPCGTQPDKGDFLSGMDENIKDLGQVYIK